MMNSNRKFGAITSSSNPEEVSSTVKGFLLMFSALIPLIAGQVFHITLSAGDVSSLIGEVSTLAGLIWAIWGLGMKVLMYFFKKPTI